MSNDVSDRSRFFVFIITSPPFVIFEEEEHQDFSVTVGFITRLFLVFLNFFQVFGFKIEIQNKEDNCMKTGT